MRRNHVEITSIGYGHRTVNEGIGGRTGKSALVESVATHQEVAPEEKNRSVRRIQPDVVFRNRQEQVCCDQRLVLEFGLRLQL